MSTKPPSLTIRHIRLAGGCCIRLSGVIDETFDAKRFLEGVGGVVVVDLDEVKRITSYGVRAWVTALSQLNHTWLGFVRCRPALVAQFNMVSGFACGGHILSLYLPYTCPSGGTAFETLVDLRKHWAELAAFNPPPMQCPEHAEQAEFDDVAEGYFSYVASQPAPTAPPLVERLLGESGEPTGSLRISKDVHGDVTGMWLSGRLDDKDHFKRLADGLEGRLYVSCGDLAFTGEEGIARLLTFLRGVQVPLILGELPLGLADRVAADPVLCQTARVCTIDVPLVCARHGEMLQPVDAPRLVAAIEGAPLAVFCGRCEQLCQPAFDVRELKNLLTLSTTPLTAEIISVIEAHRNKLTEATKTMPGQGPGAAAAEAPQRYQIVRPLGAGGMAEVFLARQMGDGGFERAVVLKRILPGLVGDSGFVEMFLQEARLASRISHPNVVQIFDVGRENSQYFIVMELVSGWDLNAVLRASARHKRPFPPHLAARVVADITRALGAAYTYTDDAGKLTPIVHRDVSPHNVLISTQGHVKLSDFGIAKAGDSLSRTPTSLMKGKPAYLAPESVQTTHGQPDARVDLFAAGLIFYQLLTTVHPFRRDSDMATFEALLQYEPPPPSTVVRGLPPAVDAIVKLALAKDPNRRYQTAQQMERDLERVVAGSGTVAAADVARWIKEMPELMPLPLNDSADQNTAPGRRRT
ncbi:MAG: serine/threonine protein kinase [Archangiaceae bacterium]|nr:serine/threonine protein kinase [Archangiaceae bacterium]